MKFRTSTLVIILEFLLIAQASIGIFWLTHKGDFTVATENITPIVLQKAPREMTSQEIADDLRAHYARSIKPEAVLLPSAVLEQFKAYADKYHGQPTGSEIIESNVKGVKIYQVNGSLYPDQNNLNIYESYSTFFSDTGTKIDEAHHDASGDKISNIMMGDGTILVSTQRY
jgi:hypothetical protein